MSRSTRSGVSGEVGSIDSQTENSIRASDSDASETATSIPAPRATSSETATGEESMCYRITALIAMLLLAVAALAVWLYLRVT